MPAKQVWKQTAGRGSIARRGCKKIWFAAQKLRGQSFEAPYRWCRSPTSEPCTGHSFHCGGQAAAFGNCRLFRHHNILPKVLTYHLVRIPTYPLELRTALHKRVLQVHACILHAGRSKEPPSMSGQYPRPRVKAVTVLGLLPSRLMSEQTFLPRH